MGYKEERENWRRRKESETRLPHSQDVHQESLLSTVKRCKWVFFGHVTRHNTLSKSVLRSTFGGSRHRGGHSKNWVTNVSDRTGHPMTSSLLPKIEKRRRPDCLQIGRWITNTATNTNGSWGTDKQNFVWFKGHNSKHCVYERDGWSPHTSI